MARFDVYRTRDFDEVVLDCQADVLDDLPTRFVVPLVPAARIGRIYERLNPVLSVSDGDYVMATQYAATVPVKHLGKRIGALSTEQAAIMNALDMLLTGY
ncbi:CcdB family protein [Sphingomonas sp. PAMC 26605]|uniref:CcdB family protein n=1 Tax=Sphingomonas sp. PAMC 26605 TaxID=1112214 RepID=UPI00026CCBAB|nr:CcdB family protein [Sphingomonas sp. PAMC 26605]